jgi:hypothetical protein
MIERHTETDPMLRRFERNQFVAAVSLAVGALAVSRRLDILVGVICGAALMAFSYRAIKGGVELLMPTGGRTGAAAASGTAGPAEATANPTGIGSGEIKGQRAARRWALAARFVGRYALLALAAYVMLAYLHAHPVGLLLGAASPVIAVAVEAARFVRTSSRPGHTR